VSIARCTPHRWHLLAAAAIAVVKCSSSSCCGWGVHAVCCCSAKTHEFRLLLWCVFGSSLTVANGTAMLPSAQSNSAVQYREHRCCNLHCAKRNASRPAADTSAKRVLSQNGSRQCQQHVCSTCTSSVLNMRPMMNDSLELHHQQINN
jgi:hypothetical protein